MDRCKTVFKCGIEEGSLTYQKKQELELKNVDNKYKKISVHKDRKQNNSEIEDNLVNFIKPKENF